MLQRIVLSGLFIILTACTTTDLGGQNLHKKAQIASISPQSKIKSKAQLQNNYASSLYDSGKYQQALKHFLLAAKDPQYPDAASAYEKAGLCALKIHDAQHAVEYFYLALAQDPHRVIAQNELSKLGWNVHAKAVNAYFP